jgi:hypothetical protein
VANIFVAGLGKSSLGLSLGLTAAEALMAPAMPSTTARAGGIFMPVITSLSAASGSLPGERGRGLARAGRAGRPQQPFARSHHSTTRSTAQLLDRTGQIAGVGAWDIDLRTREVRWSTQIYRIYERPLDWRPGIEDGMDYCAPEARRNATDELHASRERLGLVREAVVGAPATGLLHGQPAERREALACVRERLHAQGGIEGLAGEPGASRRRGLAHADVGRGGARCRRAQRSAAGRVRGHLRDRAAAGRTGAQRAGLDGVQAGAGAGRPRCRPRA